eukprot:130290-Hanusia_phi.AAC.1
MLAQDLLPSISCSPPPFLLPLLLLLVVVPGAQATLGLTGGQSSVSFCVTDKSSAHVSCCFACGPTDVHLQLFYLTDLTSPLLGQTLSEEQFSQGKLILGGGALPDFKVQLVGAGHEHVSEDHINWSLIAHRRQLEYFTVLDRMTRVAPLASSSYLSVVPIGLAGAVNHDLRQQTSLPEAQRNVKQTRGRETEAFAPRVPRLWPVIADALRNSSIEAQARVGEEQMVMISSVSRFVVSLLRFKVRVVEEEQHYMNSVNMQEMRRKSLDAHPDLREGQLRSDLPHAYVSEILYGHRLLVSANVSLPINPRDPPLESTHIAHNLMRVVAKELSAATFDSLYPQANIFARFRWDPDLPPPKEAIAKMLAMKLQRYGDAQVGFNHSATTCPLGSFRRFEEEELFRASAVNRHGRSKHLLSSQLESCPLSDEWPSSSKAHLSWVMRGGGAAMLLARIDEWRKAMTNSPSTVGQSVPLALKVGTKNKRKDDERGTCDRVGRGERRGLKLQQARRSLTSKDVNYINEQLKRMNVSSLYEKTEDVKIRIGYGRGPSSATQPLLACSLLFFLSPFCWSSEICSSSCEVVASCSSLTYFSPALYRFSSSSVHGSTSSQDTSWLQCSLAPSSIPLLASRPELPQSNVWHVLICMRQARLSDYIRLPTFISASSKSHPARLTIFQVRPVSLRLYLVSLFPSDPHTA